MSDHYLWTARTKDITFMKNEYAGMGADILPQSLIQEPQVVSCVTTGPSIIMGCAHEATARTQSRTQKILVTLQS